MEAFGAMNEAIQASLKYTHTRIHIPYILSISFIERYPVTHTYHTHTIHAHTHTDTHTHTLTHTLTHAQHTGKQANIRTLAKIW